MKFITTLAAATLSIAAIGCSSQPKQFSTTEQRAVDAYVQTICVMSTDETHAGMQPISLVTLIDMDAYANGGGDPVLQEAARIARERGCVS